MCVRVFLPELANTFNDFDSKLDRVVEKHEKDFLSAYRGHMLKVQKELSFLKKKANEQEFKLRKDDRIKSLEVSLDWFRKEALKLGSTCENFKREVEKWKSKADALEDDKSFLEKQLLKAKRQNKLLKVALDTC